MVVIQSSMMECDVEAGLLEIDGDPGRYDHSGDTTCGGQMPGLRRAPGWPESRWEVRPSQWYTYLGEFDRIMDVLKHIR